MTGRTIVLVTGASRGFGRCLCLDFARQVEGDLELHLWARNAQDLQATEARAQEIWKTRQECKQHQLTTHSLAIDLGQPSDYLPKFEALLQQIKAGRFTKIYVMHNAASLGEVTFTQEWTGHEAIQKYLELNVTSVMSFNNRFLQEFGATRAELAQATSHSLNSSSSDEASKPRSVLVNISSLWAIEPAQTSGMYCSGKAAREMHHRVIALEQKPLGRVRTLNYSPGPMDTEMQSHLRSCLSVHEYLRKTFADMKSEGTLVPPEKSSALLVAMLIRDDFETGSHPDYFELTKLPRDYYK